MDVPVRAMSGVSILILTFNEEINLGECIDSCAWSDDIVVFDSMSNDGTGEIARSKGARWFERRFDNFAAQRNAGLTSVKFKHSWVLMVDADERVPADLAAEISSAVATAHADVCMFRMRRKDFFLGKWLRRSSGYPTWFGRLVRIGRVAVKREINEEYTTDGLIGRLENHLQHFPFNKGTAYWFERHNKYSNVEAIAKFNLHLEDFSVRDLLSLDPFVRRRALKLLGYRLPLRPQLAFLYLYVFRLGMLDGRAGFYFSQMRAAYELMIDLKNLEIQRKGAGHTPGV